MTGWVVATETIRPLPVARTLTRVCRESLYTLIPLGGKYGKGKFAYVSLEDYAHLIQFGWSGTDGGYAINNRVWGSRRKSPLMHREIMVRMGLAADPFGRFLSDHRNRNRLDNRRTNLRLATRQQNASNAVQPRRESGYIGVYTKSDGEGYGISIRCGNEQFAAGGFKSPEIAARVRDALARHYHGAYAVTNFEGTEAYDIHTARKIRRRLQGQTSIYLGVNDYSSPTGVRWQARVRVGNKRQLLGRYDTEEEAARVVDEALVAQGLPRVNFPNEATTASPTGKARSADEIFNDYKQGKYSSAYRGVRVARGHYEARIKPYGAKGRGYHLGYYSSAEEAARVFDAAARYFYGQKAMTNFSGTEALSPEQIKLRREPLPRHPNKASKYVGVSIIRRAGKWLATFRYEGIKIDVGTFPTEEAAARAVDDARVAHGLPRVNFPNG